MPAPLRGLGGGVPWIPGDGRDSQRGLARGPQPGKQAPSKCVLSSEDPGRRLESSRDWGPLGAPSPGWPVRLKSIYNFSFSVAKATGGQWQSGWTAVGIEHSHHGGEFLGTWGCGALGLGGGHPAHCRMYNCIPGPIEAGCGPDHQKCQRHAECLRGGGGEGKSTPHPRFCIFLVTYLSLQRLSGKTAGNPSPHPTM